MRLEYISRIKDGLKRYKTISTKKTTSRVLDGSYNSIYKGRSMNFDELREYVPGDDVKDIDWKATSRSQKVLIRQYIAEKKHNIMLVMDTNRRMLADTSEGEEKREVALIGGGSLAYMVTSNGDYVSAIYSDGEKMCRFPFRMGFLNLETILSGYNKAVSLKNNSNIDQSLEYIIRNIRRRMIVVIVTDMEGISKVSESLLRQLILVHDVLLINVSDADVFGKNVYGIEQSDYLPAYITRSKKLRKLQQEEKRRVLAECDNKLKRNGIAMTTIRSSVTMPTSVKLRNMLDYSTAPIVIVGALLLLITLVVVIYILVRVIKSRKNKRKVTAKELLWTKPDMNKLKKDYLARLEKIEKTFLADPTLIRPTYEKMSKLIRNFAYEATGIEVQKYTLYEIRMAKMNSLADLVEEYYEPEFDRISEGDAKESIKKTKRTIAEWN